MMEILKLNPILKQNLIMKIMMNLWLMMMIITKITRQPIIKEEFLINPVKMIKCKMSNRILYAKMIILKPLLISRTIRQK